MNLTKKIFATLAIVAAFLMFTGTDAQAAELTAYTHTGNPMANGEYPYVGAVASND